MKIEIRKVKYSDTKPLRELMDDKEVTKQLWCYPYPCPLRIIKKI